MTTIYLETSDDATQVRSLVDAAIKREIAHLELALTLAKQRLIPFEQKHGVSSERFMSSMTAEDLSGGDDEYIQWAGECALVQDLHMKINQLRGVTYRDSGIL
ncbi:hypothetical protein [Candidatus Chloroploca sp. Khr17]|uniref:hypothetical protein n=1 Tax=Candidatus Chloroploca sp. Khr17 TaxID=2496869 RepID=UPI00101C69FA|nr:hypothetical protein [Candidatus Chloroploca sp. Khr17]